MQPKLVFNCFKLCLLVVFCTAAPAADSDLSSGEENQKRIIKLQGTAPDSDSDLLSAETAAGKIVKLQVIGNSDAFIPTNRKKLNAENADASAEPIHAEEKDIAPVADEAIDDEKPTSNELQDDKLDADKDVSAADEPLDRGNLTTSNIQHTGKPKEGVSTENNPNNSLSSENKSVDNKAKEQDENDRTFPTPSDTKEKVIPSITKNCPSGTSDCRYDLKKLSKMPGFQFSPAEITKFKIWPEAKIPYYIDEFSYDKVLRDKIRFHLDEATSLTELEFEELTEPPEDENERWVFFVNRRGQLDCMDYNTNSFTNSGVQKVVIGYNCLEYGGPMAAIVMALAGVPPQHNAPDRDRYIAVVTDHILPEKKGLFSPLKDGDWLFHDLEYDINSVSHYPSHKYTADGSETIKILEPEKHKKIYIWASNTEKKTYSDIDLLKIRYLYNYIIMNKPWGIKPEDCKALYRRGPNFKNMKLREQKRVLARPKPKKYLAAVGDESGYEKLVGKNRDFYGEQLSSLEEVI